MAPGIGSGPLAASNGIAKIALPAFEGRTTLVVEFIRKLIALPCAPHIDKTIGKLFLRIT